MRKFIHRRKRNESYSKMLAEQQKAPQKSHNGKVILISIIILAAAYIYKIPYLEALGFILLIGVGMNIGKKGGFEEGYQKGFFEGYDKAVENQ